MKVLNNRYHLLKKLEQNKNVISFLAKDTCNLQTLVKVSIIDSEKLTEEKLYAFLKVFEHSCGLIHASVQRDIEFDVLRHIDGQNTDRLLHIITCSCSEEYVDFILLSEKLEVHDKVKIFLQICCILHYLHSMGKSYNNLSLSSIMLEQRSGNYNAILKSLCSAALNGHTYNYDYDTKHDMDCLCEMLIELLAKDTSINNIQCLEERLNGIVELSQFDTVVRLIEDICDVFGSNFNIDVLYRANNLNYDTTFIGREREMKLLMDKVKLMHKAELSERIAFVHGARGIGKTEFLLDAIKQAKLIGTYVHCSLDLHNEMDFGDNKASVNLLKSIIKISDKQLLEKFKPYISMIMPEFELKGDYSSEHLLIDIQDKKGIIDCITEFVSLAIEDKPTLLLVDNISYADSDLINIIKRISERKDIFTNLMCVISYNDDIDATNEEFKNFLRFLTDNSTVVDIPLKGMSAEETDGIINDILPVKLKHVALSKIMLDITMGNPMFIKEFMHYLWAQQLFVFNKHNREWTLRDDIDFINIHSNLENVIQRNIEGLCEQEKSILSIISVFNIPVCLTILRDMFDYSKADSLTKGLVEKGILIEEVRYGKRHYKFRNCLMKSQIYKKFDKDSKRIIHNIASQVLEELVDKERAVYFHEMTYHLRMGKNRKKEIKSYIEHANIMEKNRNDISCIYYLEAAATIYEKEAADAVKHELLMRLGEKKRDIGNYSDSKICYSSALNVAKKLNNEKLCVDVLFEWGRLCFYLLDLSTLKRILKAIENHLVKEDYLSGRLKLDLLKLYMFFNNGNYDIAIETADKILKYCPADDYFVLGATYHQLGRIRLTQKRYEDAVKNLQIAMDCLNKGKLFAYSVFTLLNLSHAYSELNDIDMEYEYIMKAKKLVLLVKSKREAAYVYYHVGNVYYKMGDYDSGLIYYNQAMRLAKKLSIPQLEFYNMIGTELYNLRKYDFAAAYAPLNRIEEAFSALRNRGIETDWFSVYSAQMYFELGDIRTFLEKREEYEILIYNLGNCTDIHKIYEILSKITQDTIGINTLIADIIGLISKIKNNGERYYILLRVCLFLHDKGFMPETEWMLKEIQIDETHIYENSVLNAVRYYVETGKESSYEQLMQLYEVVKLSKCEYLMMKTEQLIGNYFCKAGCFDYGLFYYLEAGYKLMKSLKQLPDQYWLRFINTHGLYVHIEHMLEVIKNNKMYGSLDKDLFKNVELTQTKILSLFSKRTYSVLLKKKALLKAARDIHLGDYPVIKSNVEDWLSSVNTKVFYNLDMICQCIAYEFVCNYVYLLTPDLESNSSIIACNVSNAALPRDYSIFRESCKYKKASCFDYTKQSSEDKLHLYKNHGIKAALCIPLYSQKSDKAEITDEIQINSKLLGYLYMEACSIVNGLSLANMDSFDRLGVLIASALEKAAESSGLVWHARNLVRKEKKDEAVYLWMEDSYNI